MAVMQSNFGLGISFPRVFTIDNQNNLPSTNSTIQDTVHFYANNSKMLVLIGLRCFHDSFFAQSKSKRILGGVFDLQKYIRLVLLLFWKIIYVKLYLCAYLLYPSRKITLLCSIYLLSVIFRRYRMSYFSVLLFFFFFCYLRRTLIEQLLCSVSCFLKHLLLHLRRLTFLTMLRSGLLIFFFLFLQPLL